MSKIINIASFQDFAQICAELVKNGVSFEADATKLTIEFTGGF